MSIRPAGHFERGQRVGGGHRKAQRAKNTKERLLALWQAPTGPAHRSDRTVVKHDFSLVLRDFALHIGFAYRNALQQAMKQDHIQRLRQHGAADLATAGLGQRRVNVHV